MKRLKVRHKDLSDEKTQEINDCAENFLDNGRKLAKYNGPILILHAKDDHLLPVSYAEDLFAACTSEKKEIELFELGRHSISTWNPDKFFDTIRNFVTKILPEGHIELFPQIEAKQEEEEEEEQNTGFFASFFSLFRSKQ